MHQSLRRRYCRILFVALCLLPTMGVLAWGTVRRWPGHAARQARGIADGLGLEVRVERVEYPAPFQVRYHGLQLLDPETGLRVMHSRVVDVFETELAWQVEASQPEFDAAGAERLWRLIERRLRHELPADRRGWQFTAAELTWRYGELAQSLVEVDARVATIDTGDEAQFSFRLPGVTAQSPAILRWVRRTTDRRPALGLSVDSGGAALPAHLLAPLLDGRQWLGSRARFRGYLWLDETPAGWRGEMAGNLSEVDLERLVSAQFPHTLAGTAEIEIERAIVERGRVEEASGTVIAGPGQVGRSLLYAGCQQLGLGEGTGPLPAQNIVPFDRLAFDFAMREGQLALRGRCPGDQSALLMSGGETHWRQPPAPQPIAGLIRALVPADETQVPATRESQWLTGVLPVPRTLPTTTEPPRVHIKPRVTAAD